MKRNTWSSLAVLLALGAIAYFVLQQPGEKSVKATSENVLVKLDSAAVTRLEISSTNDEIVLEKEGDIWYLTAPISKARAAEHMVTRAVGAGTALHPKTLVSTNPEKQSLFKVDSAGTRVKFSDREGKSSTIVLGKTTTSFTETYVRLEGSNEVYIAEGALTSIYDRKPKDWRDKAIFKTARESITEVTFHYGDTTFTASRKDSVWKLDDITIGEPTSFIAALSKFDTEDFVDTTIAKLPRLSATIEVGGIEIRFYFHKETDKYLVQTTESSQWYTVPLWRAKQVLKRRPEFLAMRKSAT
jgi:hypothetical protein